MGNDIGESQARSVASVVSNVMLSLISSCLIIPAKRVARTTEGAGEVDGAVLNVAGIGWLYISEVKETPVGEVVLLQRSARCAGKTTLCLSDIMNKDFVGRSVWGSGFLLIEWVRIMVTGAAGCPANLMGRSSTTNLSTRFESAKGIRVSCAKRFRKDPHLMFIISTTIKQTTNQKTLWLSVIHVTAGQMEETQQNGKPD